MHYDFLNVQAWKVRSVFDLVDEFLGGEYSKEEALRCIQVGLLCSNLNRQQDPTMASAFKRLLGEDLWLQEKMAHAHSPPILEHDDAPDWETDWPDYDFF